MLLSASRPLLPKYGQLPNFDDHRCSSLGERSNKSTILRLFTPLALGRTDFTLSQPRGRANTIQASLAVLTLTSQDWTATVKVTSYWLRMRRVCSGSTVPGVFPARVQRSCAHGPPTRFLQTHALLPISFPLGTNRNMIQSERGLHSRSAAKRCTINCRGSISYGAPGVVEYLWWGGRPALVSF
jgi:hypothetical protein